MTHRFTSLLAWAVAATSVAALLAMPTILAPAVEAARPAEPTPFGILEVLVVLGFASFAVVGALVASHHPRSAIGWALLVIGLSFPSSISLQEFFNVAPRDPFPGAAWVALVAQVLWIPFIALMPIVVLIFPGGRLPSRRWRPYVVAHFMFFGVRSLADLGAPVVGRPEASGVGYENPLPFAEVLLAVGRTVPDFGPIYAVWFLVPVVALVRRLRRARGVEQQQLKWFVFSAAIMVFLVSAVAVLSAAGVVEGRAGDALWMLVLLSYTMIPVSIAIAIFRFRLYEIDVLINRTLVYGALTALLGAVYVLAVVGSQAVLGPLTGGGEIAVAASTLIVVALFQPLRRRIQDVVDRRFYRSRYDAQRTLDAFAAHLRDEVQLDDVRAQLISAVHATVQPRAAGLWLRSPSGALPRSSVGASELPPPPFAQP